MNLEHGNRKHANGLHLTLEDVTEIRRMHKAGKSARWIARKFGYADSWILRIIKGHTPKKLFPGWRHNRFRFTEKQEAEIFQKYCDGLTQAQLCNLYKVGKNTMPRIIQRVKI